MTLPAFLRDHPDGALVSLKVQPRASINEIGEPLGGELRIRIAAPPVDSAANDALVRFLAEQLGCPRNQVQLIRGQTSRHKVVQLQGISAADALAKLVPQSA